MKVEDNVELVGEIARALVHSDGMSAVEWVEATVVFGVDEDGDVDQTYGYAYDAAGKFTAIAPDPGDFDVSIGAYRDWLRDRKEGFRRLLFQFNRETSRYNMEFDYDPDSPRWRVTPANIDTVIEELRPKLGRYDDHRSDPVLEAAAALQDGRFAEGYSRLSASDTNVAPIGPAGDGERTVTVAIKTEDLIHTQRLTILRNYRRPRTILVLAAVPFALTAAVASLIGATDDQVWLADLVPFFLVVCAVMAATIALRWLLVPHQARRILRESPAVGNPVKLAWSENGLTAASAYGTGTIPWRDLHGWAEDRDTFVIYTTRGVAQTVPKRLLSNAQSDDFRHHLEGIPDRRRRLV